ncbi:hypothetical protein C2845_PM16G18410 [Panicum miliaceum]|uniref:Uncharacterized protein n=1 Tax=Panicum miliaceum TaxID=4540 RepID=A0A3L6Q0Q9_PANMI|nr:hypothetical protein C2845_PM16G18410 [Panicum miliaceum]
MSRQCIPFYARKRPENSGKEGQNHSQSGALEKITHTLSKAKRKLPTHSWETQETSAGALLRKDPRVYTARSDVQ